MKKLLTFIVALLSVIACAQTTFKIPNKQVDQYASGDSLSTILQADSVKFKTDKSQFIFNKKVAAPVLDGKRIYTDELVDSVGQPLITRYPDGTVEYTGINTLILSEANQTTYGGVNGIPALKISFDSTELKHIGTNYITFKNDSALFRVPTNLSTDLTNYVTTNTTQSISGTKTFEGGVLITDTDGASLLDLTNTDKPSIVGLGISTNSTMPALSVDNTGTGYAIEAYNINLNSEGYVNSGADTLATKSYARGLGTNYVTTNTTQSISGAKTFSSAVTLGTINNTAGNAAFTTSTSGLTGNQIRSTTGATLIACGSSGTTFRNPNGGTVAQALNSGFSTQYPQGTALKAISAIDSTLTLYHFRNNAAVPFLTSKRDSVSLYNPISTRAGLSFLNGFNVLRYPSGRAAINLSSDLDLIDFRGSTGKQFLSNSSATGTSLRYSDATSAEAMNIDNNSFKLLYPNGVVSFSFNDYGWSANRSDGSSIIYSDIAETSIYFPNGDSGINLTSTSANYFGIGGRSLIEAIPDSTLIYRPNGTQKAMSILDDNLFFRMPTVSNNTHTAQTFIADVTQDRTFNKGEIGWSAQDDTPLIGLGGGINLNVGEESLVGVRNNNAYTISSLKAVYPTGVTGLRSNVDTASVFNFEKSLTVAITTAPISSNTNSKATTFGIVRDENTSGLIAGKRAYLSTSGGLTNDTTGKYIVELGRTLVSHNTQGSFFANVKSPLYNDPTLATAHTTIAPTVSATKAYVDNKLLSHYAYGGIYLYDGVTGQSIANGTTYTKFTGFTNSDNVYNVTASTANDEFTATVAGLYQVEMNLVVQTSAAQNVRGTVFKTPSGGSASEQNNIHGACRLGTTSDLGSINGVGFVYLAVGDKVDCRLRHDGGSSLTVTAVYGNFTVNLVRAY